MLREELAQQGVLGQEWGWKAEALITQNVFANFPSALNHPVQFCPLCELEPNIRAEWIRDAAKSMRAESYQ